VLAVFQFVTKQGRGIHRRLQKCIHSLGVFFRMIVSTIMFRIPVHLSFVWLSSFV
jgi:hypothetical protein